MKRPVSVTTPTYKASAIDCVAATSRPRMRSHTSSAVQDAVSTTWLIVPNRVLSWWWSMLIVGAVPSRLSTSAAVRSMLPQSRYTSVREQRSAGGGGGGAAGAGEAEA